MQVKTYLQRQWSRILSGKVSLQDFVFSKEVRLGTYSARASSLPPAAIVAIKAMRTAPGQSHGMVSKDLMLLYMGNLELV